MNRLERILLDAAKQQRARCRSELATLRAEETRLIAEAVREHVALPDHYWQVRHLAEEKARAASRLVEALRP